MSLPITTRQNGQVIDETWFNIINSELVAIDEIIDLLRTNTILPFEIQGHYSAESSFEGLMYYRLSEPITIQSAVLVAISAGASGSIQADVKFKRGAGAWTSLFTTKPAVPHSAGDLANSATGTGATAAVLDSGVTELEAGDYLRFDLTAVQTNGVGLLLALGYKKTGT